MRAERVEEAARALCDAIQEIPNNAEGWGAANKRDNLRAALALPADAPEGAGEAVAFNEDVEREQATDELARECFDGPVPPAREADAWIDGWLARARHAHPTPRAEAASAEAVRVVAALLDREYGHAVKFGHEGAALEVLAALRLTAPASAEAVARAAAIQAVVLCYERSRTGAPFLGDAPEIVEAAAAHALRAKGAK